MKRILVSLALLAPLAAAAQMQITPAMAKDSITAGPALAAPTPVRVRMPVPTIAPTPSATRCGQDKVGFSR